MKWIKASERLPEKAGRENSVIVRKVNKSFVTYGFKNFHDEPQLYIELGGRSYLTTKGVPNSNQMPIDWVEWLDESPSPQAGSEMYRWVKAKEREPVIGDYYFCKVDTKKDCVFETIVEWCEHKNGEHKYNDWDLENVSHFGDSIGEDAEVIEWLEPIPDGNQDELWNEIGTRIMDGYDNMDKQDEVTKELSSKYIIVKR